MGERVLGGIYVLSSLPALITAWTEPGDLPAARAGGAVGVTLLLLVGALLLIGKGRTAALILTFLGAAIALLALPLIPFTGARAGLFLVITTSVLSTLALLTRRRFRGQLVVGALGHVSLFVISLSLVTSPSRAMVLMGVVERAPPGVYQGQGYRLTLPAGWVRPTAAMRKLKGSSDDVEVFLKGDLKAFVNVLRLPLPAQARGKMLDLDLVLEKQFEFVKKQHSNVAREECTLVLLDNQRAITYTFSTKNGKPSRGHILLTSDAEPTCMYFVVMET